MKEKTSPRVAPSPARRRWANAERAFFRNKNPARLPEQLAGESRKIRRLGDMGGAYTRPGGPASLAPDRGSERGWDPPSVLRRVAHSSGPAAECEPSRSPFEPWESCSIRMQN